MRFRQQLLFNALRAPSRNNAIHPPVTTIYAQGFYSTSTRKLIAPSVSFGPETDALLLSFAKTKRKLKKQLKENGKAIPEQSKRRDGATVTGGFIIDDDVIAVAQPVKQEEVMSKSQTSDKIPSTAGHIPDTTASTASPISRKAKATKARKLQGSTTTASKSLRSVQPPTPQPTPLQQLRADPNRKLEPWEIQKAALRTKFGDEAWAPRKKLSPDAMEGIRSLHESDPERFSTPVLAQQFQVSAEAIRRILKSKWMNKMDPEVMDDRRQRWARRHDRIWDAKAELGLRPPRHKERMAKGPEEFEAEVRQKIMLGQM